MGILTFHNPRILTPTCRVSHSVAIIPEEIKSCASIKSVSHGAISTGSAWKRDASSARIRIVSERASRNWNKQSVKDPNVHIHYGSHLNATIYFYERSSSSD